MCGNSETVRLDRLRIGYAGKHGEQKVVADNINASLRRGELACLVGPNGIGKSTLLQTLCAFLPKLGGGIIINGQEIGTYNDSELSRLIGVVLTSKPNLQNMTVEELVAMGRSPYTGFWGRLSSADRAIVAEAMEMVGIEPLKRRLVQTLSDGERQKTMIAKALAQQTSIIFLDEPTAFLDYPSKVDTMRLLYQLSKETGKTVFLSTHDLELTLQIADKVWLMDNDGIHIGTPRELADNGSLAHFVERDGIAFDAATLRVRVMDKSAPARQ